VKTLEINSAGPGLAKAVEALKDEPLVVTRDGVPLAVLVPAAGVNLETVALSLSPQFRAVLENSAQRHHAEGGIAPEEMRRRLGVKPPRSGAPAGRRKAPSKKA
jgi:hypothetical protein